MLSDKLYPQKDEDGMVEYDQPTAAPTPKIRAVATSGITYGGIVALLALFGVIIPEDLSNQSEAAMKALLVLIPFIQAAIQFAAGYFKRDKKPAIVVEAIRQAERSSL